MHKTRAMALRAISKKMTKDVQRRSLPALNKRLILAPKPSHSFATMNKNAAALESPASRAWPLIDHPKQLYPSFSSTRRGGAVASSVNICRAAPALVNRQLHVRWFGLEKEAEASDDNAMKGREKEDSGIEDKQNDANSRTSGKSKESQDKDGQQLQKISVRGHAEDDSSAASLRIISQPSSIELQRIAQDNDASEIHRISMDRLIELHPVPAEEKIPKELHAIRKELENISSQLQKISLGFAPPSPPQVGPRLRSGVVDINVGGLVVTTTWETLQVAPELVAEIERAVSKGYVKDGMPFIDRNPTHFSIILNYLRGIEVALPRDQDQLTELYAEAEFFGLKDFKTTVKQTTIASTLFGNSVVQSIMSKVGLPAGKISQVAMSGVFFGWWQKVLAAGAALGAPLLALGVRRGWLKRLRERRLLGRMMDRVRRLLPWTKKKD